jgi:hypothetical protein
METSDIFGASGNIYTGSINLLKSEALLLIWLAGILALKMQRNFLPLGLSLNFSHIVLHLRLENEIEHVYGVC